MDLSEYKNTSFELDKGFFNLLSQVAEAPSIGRRDQDRQMLPGGTGTISVMGMKGEINYVLDCPLAISTKNVCISYITEDSEEEF